MTKEDFIVNFMSNFISSWAGHNYLEYCTYGKAGELYDNLPVEDAEHLALRAWELISDQRKISITNSFSSGGI